jgi:ADP-heptose:LPS heptosyltransferase
MDLGELTRMVASARLIICGDTGVGHLATALSTASVLLFGPTPPRLWGPPPALHDRHTVLWAGEAGDPHASTTDPGLTRISVTDVIHAAEFQLSKPREKEPRLAG